MPLHVPDPGCTRAEHSSRQLSCRPGAAFAHAGATRWISEFALAALEPGAFLLNALAAPGQPTALHLARVCKPLSRDEHSSQEIEALARTKASLRSTVEQIRAGSLAPSISEQHLPVIWLVIRPFWNYLPSVEFFLGTGLLGRGFRTQAAIQVFDSRTRLNT